MPDGLGAFALVVAAAVLALLLLLVWLLSRDRSVTRTSFGLYVERKRVDDRSTYPLVVSQYQPTSYGSTPAPFDQQDTAEHPIPPWPVKPTDPSD